jgi:hypothetical protein
MIVSIAGTSLSGVASCAVAISDGSNSTFAMETSPFADPTFTCGVDEATSLAINR